MKSDLHLTDPCLNPGSEEYNLRKLKFEMWEEFDRNMCNIIEKFGLNEKLRIELFRIFAQYVEEKLFLKKEAL